MLQRLVVVLCAAVAPAACAVVAPCGFEEFFRQNKEGPGIHKWLHYFPAYEQEFMSHCGASAKPVKMLEIGIQSGGSMRMWRACFGDMLEALVGVDINPDTSAWERFGAEPGSKQHNVHVEVGSQADAAVMERINATYPGGFDIILDDGSHVAEHMVATFRHAWSMLRPGGVFFIEDITKENVQALHAIISGPAHPYYQSVRIKGHSFVDAMYDNRGAACCNTQTNGVQREVEYVKMYPMILAIRKREIPLDSFHAKRHGTEWIPYSRKST